MKQIKTQSIISAVTLAAAAGVAQTQPAAVTAPPAPPAPAPSQSNSLEEWVDQSKKPVSWLTWGADLRLRNEYFDNALSLNEANPLSEQDYFRYRGRVWASVAPITNLSFNARLSAEPRTWMKPSFSGTSPGPTPGQQGTDWAYGIFDNFNVQWKNIADQPMSLTVGRQDFLTFLDSWLVMDGTPRDGSWTYFLDAARLTYELKEQKTTIDAIGILQYANENEWLPVINHMPSRYLTEQNEKGAILNVGNKLIPEANIDGYFIYKHDTRLNHPDISLMGDDADIFTLGARVSGLVAEHWKYSAEGAYQFGEKKDPAVTRPGPTTDFRDLSAFGLNSKGAYLFKDRLNTQISFSYEFLSGDDPKTSDDEMFDLLWGRWPRWSELYNVYSYVSETRVAQTANLHRFGPGLTISPCKKSEFIANYFALFADQEVPTRGRGGQFSNDGNFRGHYLQAILKYKFNKHVAGHLWSEFVFPGDFYNNKDLMTFLRAELYLTY